MTTKHRLGAIDYAYAAKAEAEADGRMALVNRQRPGRSDRGRLFDARGPAATFYLSASVLVLAAVAGLWSGRPERDLAVHCSIFIRMMVPPTGLEPVTPALRRLIYRMGKAMDFCRFAP